MLQRPVLKPHLSIRLIEGEGVFVLSELRQIVLQGRLFELVLPALDGCSAEDVCRKLAGKAAPAGVFYTIRNLEERGFLCEATDRPVPDAALWSLQSLDPATANERLARRTVSVHGLGVNVGGVTALLEKMGVRVATDGDLKLVLVDSYLNKGLYAINDEAVRSGQPWLLAKPYGVDLWIGPFFQPGETACWECLSQRIRANFPVTGYLDSLLDQESIPGSDRPLSAAMQAVADGMTANIAALWMARDAEMPHLKDRLQTINLISLESQSHVVLKQPSCPTCGVSRDSSPREQRPLELASRRKTFTEDGGHRAMTPQETLDAYRHLISPVTGAVTSLQNMVSTTDGVMHVFMSGNNIARGPQSLFNLKIDLRNFSCGKGTSEIQARASALCEGLERYSGIFRGDETRIRSRLVDLKGQGIHPNDCMRFSPLQYREREQRNAKSSVYEFIPAPFDPESEVDWTPVWSLSADAVKYLPTAFCYFDYPHATEEFCRGCSNGNAAGNSLEEAILQGFFELVERDAVGIWWYNRIQRPALDLDSFHEPYLDRLRASLKARNRDLWAIDLTNDLGIPVVAALSRRLDGGCEQIMFGFGAHLDARIAMLRAVTELNQMLVPIIDSPPDGRSQINDEGTVHWLKNATLANQQYLAPLPGVSRAAGDYARLWTDDLRDDIHVCRSIVEKLGHEMLVLNQTRQEIGMPVVKVIVPGLRHFWVRFGEGRLYDVPVKLGWRTTPCQEADMNPLPMFL